MRNACWHYRCGWPLVLYVLLFMGHIFPEREIIAWNDVSGAHSRIKVLNGLKLKLSDLRSLFSLR